jgi:Flp pilus assembly protein TadG
MPAADLFRRLCGLRIGRVPGAFLADRQAVAALEFALILPLLIAMTGGVFEYASFVRQSRQLTDAASGVAGILAMNVSSTVTSLDLHYANDAVMLIYPKVLADAAVKKIAWNADITIGMAGISFTPQVVTCTASCTYTASVTWTGGDMLRTCGSTLTAALNTAVPSPTTLPSALYTPIANTQGTDSPPAFVIVADLVFKWTPLLFTKIINPVTIRRSSYINPRYTNAIAYSAGSGDDGFGKQCP